MILQSVERHGKLGSGHPFELPLVRQMERLEFTTPVTFLVGENGAGKSTLLESIAIAARAVAVGGQDLELDPTLETSRDLAARLRLGWSRRTKRGFFMRAEDFFGFAQRIAQSRKEMEELEEEFEEKFDGYARKLALGVARGQGQALERYQELETSSHGEAFLHLFQERFVPEGLYFLDEPEAALSPQRQLALLSLMKELVEENAQFIVASHSPILMAFPEATILSLDQVPPVVVPWEELEHVRLTRDFLSNPERYLRHL
jgi:predicted ATPase